MKWRDIDPGCRTVSRSRTVSPLRSSASRFVRPPSSGGIAPVSLPRRLSRCRFVRRPSSGGIAPVSLSSHSFKATTRPSALTIRPYHFSNGTEGHQLLRDFQRVASYRATSATLSTTARLGCRVSLMVSLPGVAGLGRGRAPCPQGDRW